MVCCAREVFMLKYLIHCTHSGNLHCVSLQMFYLLSNPNVNVGNSNRDAAWCVRKGHQAFFVRCLIDISHNTVFTGATSCNLGNRPSKKARRWNHTKNTDIIQWGQKFTSYQCRWHCHWPAQLPSHIGILAGWCQGPAYSCLSDSGCS